MFIIPKEFLSLDPLLKDIKIDSSTKITIDDFISKCIFGPEMKSTIKSYLDGVVIENPIIESRPPSEDNEIIGNIVRQEPALPKLRDDLNINDIFLRIQASAFKNNVIFPLNKQICCFWNYVGIKNINNSISYSCTFSHITKTKNELTKSKLISEIQNLLPANNASSIIDSCKTSSIEELQSFANYLTGIKSKKDIDETARFVVNFVGNLIERSMNKPRFIGNFMIPSFTGFSSVLTESIMGSSWIDATETAINSHVNKPSRKSGVNIRRDIFNFAIKTISLFYHNYMTEQAEHQSQITDQSMPSDKNYTNVDSIGQLMDAF